MRQYVWISGTEMRHINSICIYLIFQMKKNLLTVLKFQINLTKIEKSLLFLFFLILINREKGILVHLLQLEVILVKMERKTFAYFIYLHNRKLKQVTYIVYLLGKIPFLNFNLKIWCKNCKQIKLNGGFKSFFYSHINHFSYSQKVVRSCPIGILGILY